ncbi:MAG: hypothetical protein WAS27_03155 [Candidatus Saccharimonadales bacterium]
MGNILRDLLNAEEPLFSQSVRQLEQASGQYAADVKLIGDILASAHDRMRQLRLDPADSTGHEIYQALMNKVAVDNVRLAKLIGATTPEDVAHMVPLMVQAANDVAFPRKVFVIKHASVKKLLAKMPPKNLIKTLGYKQLDDMLANEPFDELYPALRFSEGAEWLLAYNELFKTVTAKDYEERDMKIVVMDHDKYAGLAEKFVKKKLHNVTHSKELGVIVVVPMKQKTMRGLALKSLPLLLHYMNEVKLYSTFFKSKASKRHFGTVVVETLNADPGTASQLAGQHIHWRVIQRYFGKLDGEAHPEAFQPHVQPEDLHWRRAEDLLFEIDPELCFWQDLDYVGLLRDGFPVSFNLFDLSFAYSNREPYTQRYAYHFQESLWNELFIRYMGFANLNQQILKQLDNDMIAPEKLTPSGGRYK